MARGDPFVLIAAVSARALAQAARRDGYAPLVADLFGDDDTAEAAEALARLPGGLARGIRPAPLLRALARLSEGRATEGVVCGSGFESRLHLLDRLARRHGLLGNRADAVRAVKQPEALAALCARFGVPHPEVRMDRAPDEGWVRKRIGGAGGGHVRAALVGRATGRGQYVQRRIEGAPVSALLLADGARCSVLGFSEQWAAPAPRRPFRYGGAARPAALPPMLARDLADAAERVAAGARLVGLNSVDFLVGADGFHLIEVNPRPGATLDLFAAPGLFRAHMAACRGDLAATPTPVSGAAATAVVYARRPICLPRGFTWPDWAADRQPAGSPVPAYAPLCTVRADGESAEAARALVQRRIESILSLAEGSG